MTTIRRTIFRNLKAKDEVRPTDMAEILDHLEDLAGTSNAALRTAALNIHDLHQISSRDMGNFYDYVDNLGTLTTTKTQFLNRRMRDRDFMSRRHVDYMLDLIDEGFGGTYASVVRRDMGVLGGSFFEMQDGVASPLTDSVGAITDLTNGSAPAEVAGPWAGSLARAASSWGNAYTSSTLTMTVGASEDATFETFVRFDTIDGIAAYMFDLQGGGLQFAAIVTSTDGFALACNAAALADPGTWVTLTAYSQGDRRRPTVDDNDVYEVEVAGTTAVGEPTWPTDQGTVVDGTVTWRHVAFRSGFYDYITGADENVNGGRKSPSFTPVAGTWYHVAIVKNSSGLSLYVDGVLVDSKAPQTADTDPGSFGLPVRWQYDTADWTGSVNMNIGAQPAGSQPLDGAMAFTAIYDGALTVAQIAEHYASAQDSGL